MDNRTRGDEIYKAKNKKEHTNANVEENEIWNGKLETEIAK